MLFEILINSARVAVIFRADQLGTCFIRLSGGWTYAFFQKDRLNGVSRVVQFVKHDSGFE